MKRAGAGPKCSNKVATGPPYTMRTYALSRYPLNSGNPPSQRKLKARGISNLDKRSPKMQHCGLMKKSTLSFEVLAVIIAVTILQACAGTAAAQCATPTFSPTPGPVYGWPVKVTITTSPACHLSSWLDNSPARACTLKTICWKLLSPGTLKAKACQDGRCQNCSGVVVANYYRP